MKHIFLTQSGTLGPSEAVHFGYLIKITFVPDYQVSGGAKWRRAWSRRTKFKIQPCCYGNICQSSPDLLKRDWLLQDYGKLGR